MYEISKLGYVRETLTGNYIAKISLKEGVAIDDHSNDGPFKLDLQFHRFLECHGIQRYSVTDPDPFRPCNNEELCFLKLFGLI